LRVDKLTLAALEATLALYRDPARAVREIPTLAMIAADIDEIRERARRLAERLALRKIPCDVVDTEAQVGGGAFPTARILSAGLALPGNADRVDVRLRVAEPPVVGRISEGRVLLDLRTVRPERDDELASIIERAVA
jgi:L-seryl-tRNA(Ser) seleniumtransferase